MKIFKDPIEKKIRDLEFREEKLDFDEG